MTLLTNIGVLPFFQAGVLPQCLDANPVPADPSTIQPPVITLPEGFQLPPIAPDTLLLRQGAKEAASEGRFRDAWNTILNVPDVVHRPGQYAQVFKERVLQWLLTNNSGLVSRADSILDSMPERAFRFASPYWRIKIALLIVQSASSSPTMIQLRFLQQEGFGYGTILKSRILAEVPEITGRLDAFFEEPQELYQRDAAGNPSVAERVGWRRGQHLRLRAGVAELIMSNAPGATHITDRDQLLRLQTIVRGRHAVWAGRDVNQITRLTREDQLSILQELYEAYSTTNPELSADIRGEGGLDLLLQGQIELQIGQLSRDDNFINRASELFDQIISDPTYRDQVRRRFDFMNCVGCGGSGRDINEEIERALGEVYMSRAQIQLYRAGQANTPTEAFNLLFQPYAPTRDNPPTGAYQLLQAAMPHLVNEGVMYQNARQVAAEILTQMSYLVKDYGELTDFHTIDGRPLSTDQQTFYRSLVSQYGGPNIKPYQVFLRAAHSLLEAITVWRGSGSWPSDINWPGRNGQMTRIQQPLWLRQIGLRTSLGLVSQQMVLVGEDRGVGQTPLQYLPRQNNVLIHAGEELAQLATDAAALLDPEEHASIVRLQAENLIQQRLVDMALRRPGCDYGGMFARSQNFLDIAEQNGSPQVRAQVLVWRAKIIRIQSGETETQSQQEALLRLGLRYVRQALAMRDPQERPLLRMSLRGAALQAEADLISDLRDFMHASDTYGEALALSERNYYARVARADILNWRGYYRNYTTGSQRHNGALAEYALVPPDEPAYAQAALGMAEIGMRENENYLPANTTRLLAIAAETFRSQGRGSYLMERAASDLAEAWETNEDMAIRTVQMGALLFLPNPPAVDPATDNPAFAAIRARAANGDPIQLSPRGRATIYLKMVEAHLTRRNYLAADQMLRTGIPESVLRVIVGDVRFNARYQLLIEETRLRSTRQAISAQRVTELNRLVEASHDPDLITRFYFDQIDGLTDERKFRELVTLVERLRRPENISHIRRLYQHLGRERSFIRFNFRLWQTQAEVLSWNAHENEGDNHQPALDQLYNMQNEVETLNRTVSRARIQHDAPEIMSHLGDFFENPEEDDLRFLPNIRDIIRRDVHDVGQRDRLLTILREIGAAPAGYGNLASLILGQIHLLRGEIYTYQWSGQDYATAQREFGLVLEETGTIVRSRIPAAELALISNLFLEPGNASLELRPGVTLGEINSYHLSDATTHLLQRALNTHPTSAITRLRAWAHFHQGEIFRYAQGYRNVARSQAEYTAALNLTDGLIARSRVVTLVPAIRDRLALFFISSGATALQPRPNIMEIVRRNEPGTPTYIEDEVQQGLLLNILERSSAPMAASSEERARLRANIFLGLAQLETTRQPTSADSTLLQRNYQRAHQHLLSAQGEMLRMDDPGPDLATTYDQVQHNVRSRVMPSAAFDSQVMWGLRDGRLEYQMRGTLDLTHPAINWLHATGAVQYDVGGDINRFSAYAGLTAYLLSVWSVSAQYRVYSNGSGDGELRLLRGPEFSAATTLWTDDFTATAAVNLDHEHSELNSFYGSAMYNFSQAHPRLLRGLRVGLEYNYFSFFDDWNNRFQPRHALSAGGRYVYTFDSDPRWQMESHLLFMGTLTNVDNVTPSRTTTIPNYGFGVDAGFNFSYLMNIYNSRRNPELRNATVELRGTAGINCQLTFDDQGQLAYSICNPQLGLRGSF